MASLFTKRGPASASGPYYLEPTNGVVRPFSQFERQADTKETTRPCAQPGSELPREERALWEAAIQLNLVTIKTAEEQVGQGRTVAAWIAGQPPSVEGDRKGRRRRPLDTALLLALATFNILVLVAMAMAIAWVVGFLV